MFLKTSLITSIAILVILLIGARETSACSCGPTPTVLDAFKSSKLAIIAKVLSLEKSIAKLTVEKVFKGKLKVGDEITILSIESAACTWAFNEDAPGKRFLFYTNGSLMVAGCGRSRYLEDAADDLLYLEKMSEVRGKTRISGKLSFFQNSPFESGESIYKILNGTKVRIIGKNKTYEVKTDENGIYEIYGLPPGNYIINPEIPNTMKINYIYSDSNIERSDEDEEKPKEKKALVILKPGKHAYFNFALRVNNVIRGKVFDPQGQAMDGVCVNLIPASGKVSKYFYEADCTEKDGKFEIDEFPPGSYILVANDDGKLSSEEPFRTLYYPGVFESEKASIITFGKGEVREELNVYVPSVEERVTVEGVLLYSDGKPVNDEFVQFKADNVRPDIEGDTNTKTDSKGFFSLKLLKGLRGRIFGGMFTYKGDYKNCPILDRLILEKPKNISHYTVETPAIEFAATSNLRGVELKFPFPSCKKAE